MYYRPCSIVKFCYNPAQGLDFSPQTCHTTYMKNEIAMVWSVIGGRFDEGESVHSLQLFDSKVLADKYAKELEKEFDYSEVKMMEVKFASAADFE